MEKIIWASEHVTLTEEELNEMADFAIHWAIKESDNNLEKFFKELRTWAKFEAYHKILLTYPEDNSTDKITKEILTRVFKKLYETTAED